MKSSALPRVGENGAPRRKRSPKREGAKVARESGHWPPEAALHVLVAGMSSFLAAAGFERKRVAAELRQTATRLESDGAIPTPRPEDNEIMTRVCGVVHDWCWEPGYADEATGIPQALRLYDGDYSLGKLIGMRFPDRNVEEIVLWMQLNGVIARQLDGSFALVRRAVLVGGYNTVGIQRMATLATQYLETGLHNLRTRDPSRRNFDRTAWVHELPAKYVPQFRDLVREQTQAFLETIDQWLESRVALNSSEATVEAGVHAYMYIGTPTSPRPAGGRRASSSKRRSRSTVLTRRGSHKRALPE